MDADEKTPTEPKAVTDLLTLAERLENPLPGAPGFFYGRWGNKSGGSHPCGTIACAAGQACVWLDGHADEWPERGEMGFSLIRSAKNWKRDGMSGEFYEWAFLPGYPPPSGIVGLNSPGPYASAEQVAQHLRNVAAALTAFHANGGKT